MVLSVYGLLVSDGFCGCRLPAGMDHESNQVSEGHSVDALALRGDEGRGTLR